MPKVQGKQIADGTITQELLNLTTPSSGDTTSGATVSYVNTYITSVSGSTVIGPAEDGEYTDGIFTDFTEATRVGVAIDRFNEMFKLLAPTPPSENWTNVFSNLTIPSMYSARALTSGSAISNITSDTTPSYSVTDTIGTGTNSRSRNNFTFVVLDNSVTLESVTITNSSTGKTSGIIQYTIADPYFGVTGQAGFWTGVTAFSVSGTLSTISASASSRTLQFTHPGTDTPEQLVYYVDDPTSPSVGTFSATMPVMTRYISGVPSLAAASVVTNVGFTISNAVSYFYNNSMYDISGTLVVSDTANPPTTIPTTHGQTVTESGLSVVVTSTAVYDDDSFQFTVTVRNAAGTSGNANYSTSTYRIDTVSNESSRLTSGTGSYPSTGWGGTWGTNSGVSLLTNTDEMMMRNGTWIYPTGNYTSYGGPNYSTVANTRWVTFNLGTFSNNSAFTLNFIGSGGITSITGQANLLVEIKISGSTYWVDGDSPYAGTGNPGSSVDGTAAVVVGSSTATARRITFGSVTYSGAIIVRVGITNNSISFTSLTATSIT